MAVLISLWYDVADRGQNALSSNTHFSSLFSINAKMINQAIVIIYLSTTSFKRSKIFKQICLELNQMGPLVTDW